MAPRVEAAGTCSHHRQNWGAGMLPCATPGCREGRTSGRLVVHATPSAPVAFWDMEPGLEDAVAEEVTFRRTQPTNLHGAWAWRMSA